jgi:hypothetical protein
MKAFSHLWQYLAEFFLEWEMYHISHILCSVTFFRKSRRLWDNVEKYRGAWGAANDLTMWRTRVASWIRKVTRTHAQANGHTHLRGHAHTVVIFIAFPRQQWFANSFNVKLYVHCLSCSPFSTATRDVFPPPPLKKLYSESVIYTYIYEYSAHSLLILPHWYLKFCLY